MEDLSKELITGLDDLLFSLFIAYCARIIYLRRLWRMRPFGVSPPQFVVDDIARPYN